MIINKKDVSLQMIRILSMLSIVLCHLVQEVNDATIAKMGQFLNVGVYVFLFLSGWLYGNKRIGDFGNWLLARVTRVLVPMWLFLVPLFCIHFYRGTMDWLKVPVYLTNTQYWFGGIGGGQHLWFVSVIFLCYCITPFLGNKCCKLKYLIPAIVICGYFLCYLNHVLGMTFLYANVYIIGFACKNKNITFSRRHAILSIPFALFIRIIGILFMDGTVFYDCLLVYVTHTMLTLSIFTLGKSYLNLKSNRIIDWLDDISYFVYIVHYMFMVGPARTMGITNYLAINILVTLVLSLVFAMILQLIYRLSVREFIR